MPNNNVVSERSFKSKFCTIFSGFFMLGLRLRPGIEKILSLYRIFSSMVKVSRAWCKELAVKMKTMCVFLHRTKATLKLRYKNFCLFFFLQNFAQIKQLKKFSLFNQSKSFFNVFEKLQKLNLIFFSFRQLSKVKHPKVILYKSKDYSKYFKYLALLLSVNNFLILFLFPRTTKITIFSCYEAATQRINAVKPPPLPKPMSEISNWNGTSINIRKIKPRKCPFLT